MPVQIKCHPWQIAEIFQQCKQRKEDGHRRQHDGYYPGQHPVNAQYQRSREPVRRIQALGQRQQLILDIEQAVRQKFGGIVGAGDGEPKYAHQQQDHDRYGGELA